METTETSLNAKKNCDHTFKMAGRKKKKSTLISNGKCTHKNLCFLKENGHTQY